MRRWLIPGRRPRPADQPVDRWTELATEIEAITSELQHLLEHYEGRLIALLGCESALRLRHAADSASGVLHRCAWALSAELGAIPPPPLPSHVMPSQGVMP